MKVASLEDKISELISTNDKVSVRAAVAFTDLTPRSGRWPTFFRDHDMEFYLPKKKKKKVKKRKIETKDLSPEQLVEEERKAKEEEEMRKALDGKMTLEEAQEFYNGMSSRDKVDKLIDGYLKLKEQYYVKVDTIDMLEGQVTSVMEESKEHQKQVKDL